MIQALGLQSSYHYTAGNPQILDKAENSYQG